VIAGKFGGDRGMKNSAKANIALLVLVVLLSAGLFFVVLQNMRCERIAGWDAKKQLDFAETLAAKGLKKEAVTAFDDYLKTAKISAIEAAKLLYRMGAMNMEALDYEKALYYFYKAEAADPNAGFSSQLNEKLIECLENLGLTSQAQYELSQRVTSGQQQQKAESAGAVLAKVGDEEITETEINEAIKAIPDWARENFMYGEGRLEFVRQYATTQALYKKAKRMGLEQDAEGRRAVREITKKLLVQKFLENQLKGKMDISPTDIETYYEASKDKYRQNALASVSMIKISNEKQAANALRRLKVGADFAKMAEELSEDENTRLKAGLIEPDIEKGSDIPGIGYSKEASEAIFSKKEGEITDHIKIKDAYYIFRLNSLFPEKQLSFAEVKDSVEYDFKNKKIQEQMQVLVKNTLQEQQVEIYEDRILGKEAIVQEEAAPAENKPE